MRTGLDLGLIALALALTGCFGSPVQLGDDSQGRDAGFADIPGDGDGDGDTQPPPIPMPSEPDAGPGDGDGDGDTDPPPLPACGAGSCGSADVCCSNSCGLCTEDGACVAVECHEPPVACDKSQCPDTTSWVPVKCADGTAAGPACVRGDDGECHVDNRPCPPGPTERACDSSAADDCKVGEYCRHDERNGCGKAGLLTTEGHCALRPEACLLDSRPVCGCDGRTYDSACIAGSQGMNVEYDGECKEPGVECGGFVGKACPKGFYCDQGGMCLLADGTGECREMPEACPDVWKPVCGCDGKTYGNTCEAAAVGASVDREGACDGPVPCGGTSFIPGGIDGCGLGSFCESPPGMCGGFKNGDCRVLPEGCDLNFDPVCGCDGTTYSNACMAAAEAVSIESEGECPSDL